MSDLTDLFKLALAEDTSGLLIRLFELQENDVARGDRHDLTLERVIDAAQFLDEQAQYVCQLECASSGGETR